MKNGKIRIRFKKKKIFQNFKVTFSINKFCNLQKKQNLFKHIPRATEHKKKKVLPINIFET